MNSGNDTGKYANRKLWSSSDSSEGFREPNAPSNPVDLRAEYKDQDLPIIIRMRNIYLAPEGSREVYEYSETELEDILSVVTFEILKPERILNSSQVACHVERSHLCSHQLLLCHRKRGYKRTTLFLSTGEGRLQVLEVKQILGWQQLRVATTDFRCTVRRTFLYKSRETRFTRGGPDWFSEPQGLMFHAYNPPRLVDKTRKGHCKILTFLLVDPNIRVISSVIVPGQQSDRWVKEVTMDGLGVFPSELRLEIVKHIPAWN